ncbi:adiponectin receptor protein 2-like [Phycodurus eques]|uniref:adiponectin receptor protein 2-like n=1 Tax=Phycodurus eques TaxID=693459 RepID=UPI002ACDDCCB|nr:adiponectin receptor protein 2-like [Phycodurus eques]
MSIPNRRPALASSFCRAEVRSGVFKLDEGEESWPEGPALVLRHRTSSHAEHTADSAPAGAREKGRAATTSGSSDGHLSIPQCHSHNRSLPTCDEERRKKEEDARGGEEEECREDKSSDEGFMGMTPLLQAHHAMEKMEEFVHKVWEGRWRVIPHDVLPDWLKDNDFLLHGHRPPMPSFRACFRSIFRIHTETGNIWTHLLGCLFFFCLGLMYMFRPNMSFVAPVQEKVAIGMFFLGAILCLSFSWLFHTVYCHSEGVSRVFSKLDYSGIAFLIMGSFVPWLYYSFYCSPQPCIIYLLVVCVLGLSAITVSQCDFFATPQYRGVRAGVFVGLGLSGVVPTLHFVISEGLIRATTIGQMGWLLLMATLYITGACLYAARIPERFFPGKCDIWFHSHQLFHILVVAGAFVHFHGVSNLQEFRYTAGAGCTDDGML